MHTDNKDAGASRLTVPNDLGYLKVVRSFVREVAGHVGFEEDDRQRIALAVNEASTNAIEYAFAPGEAAAFDVTCRAVPSGLEVRVHDKGMPYDPTQSKAFDPDLGLEGQEGGGLGRYLMRQMMDEYHFRNLGADGKEIRLVKYLDSPSVVASAPAPATDAGAEANAKDAPSATAPQIEAIEFEVRRMRPEEAIEVARCVYDSYGYSYAGEHIYHPRRVAALNASGEVVSAVAVTPDGEVAGHNALVFHEYLPPELAVAATKRQFRGQGIATRLCAFLIDEARSMGVRALHAKQVTVHPYTQLFCGKQGYKDCGFLLGHSPKSMTFRGISDDVAQRNSDVIGILYLTPPAPVTVHPPERHAAMVERLLGGLGMQAEVKSAPSITREGWAAAQSEGGKESAQTGGGGAEVQAGGGKPSMQTSEDAVAARASGGDDARTALHVSVNTARSLAEVRVPRAAGDAVEALHVEVHQLRHEDIRVVELYLDLTDPSTPVIAPALEDLGFLFTGIMPETASGPALVMQLLNGVQIEYDELAVVSPAARELLDYIKANDPYSD